MFECVEVFFPFLTECVTDQFIEALTDLDNATRKMSGAKNQNKLKRHDDAGQKGKKKFKSLMRPFSGKMFLGPREVSPAPLLCRWTCIISLLLDSTCIPLLF